MIWESRACEKSAKVVLGRVLTLTSRSEVRFRGAARTIFRPSPSTSAPPSPAGRRNARSYARFFARLPPARGLCSNSFTQLGEQRGRRCGYVAVAIGNFADPNFPRRPSQCGRSPAIPGSLCRPTRRPGAWRSRAENPRVVPAPRRRGDRIATILHKADKSRALPFVRFCKADMASATRRLTPLFHKAAWAGVHKRRPSAASGAGPDARPCGTLKQCLERGRCSECLSIAVDKPGDLKTEWQPFILQHGQRDRGDAE